MVVKLILIVWMVCRRVVGVILTYVRRRIASSGGGAAGLSVPVSALFGVIVLGALAAGTGLLPGPSHGWFATAITLLMLHATAELGLLVINVVRNED